MGVDGAARAGADVPVDFELTYRFTDTAPRDANNVPTVIRDQVRRLAGEARFEVDGQFLDTRSTTPARYVPENGTHPTGLMKTTWNVPPRTYLQVIRGSRVALEIGPPATSIRLEFRPASLEALRDIASRFHA
jgi:hypothetical protein